MMRTAGGWDLGRLLSKSTLKAFGAGAFALWSVAASGAPLHQPISYYGETLYQELQRGMRDRDLVQELHKILSTPHQTRPGQADLIGHCDTGARSCYSHQALGYKAARKVLMGQLHLQNVGSAWVVKEVYCDRDFTNRDFGGADEVGPSRTPRETVLNTEHTWPQSKFNSAMQKDVQKSDLHHLYPTDSEMNSIRGNHPFGEVDVPDRALKCPASKFGSVHGSSADYFEPPQGHKGNVARALFYFAVRYKMSIDKVQEDFLRDWHRQDPPDQFEIDRNDSIFKIQGNRNPFIDHPELVDHIADF
jgi:deoxyribonuclease-1